MSTSNAAAGGARSRAIVLRVAADQVARPAETGLEAAARSRLALAPPELN